MATGKRYSPLEKQEIMQYRLTHTYQETAMKYNISQMTLARWNREHNPTPLLQNQFKGDMRFKTPLFALKYLEYVTGVALFLEESSGDALASINDGMVHEDALYLTVTALFSSADRSHHDLQFGKIQDLLLHYEDGMLFLRKFSPKIVLLLIYRGDLAFPFNIQQDVPFIDRICQDLILLTKNLTT